jgi:hypothetical protein
VYSCSRVCYRVKKRAKLVKVKYCALSALSGALIGVPQHMSPEQIDPSSADVATLRVLARDAMRIPLPLKEQIVTTKILPERP